MKRALALFQKAIAFTVFAYIAYTIVGVVGLLAMTGFSISDTDVVRNAFVMSLANWPANLFTVLVIGAFGGLGVWLFGPADNLGRMRYFLRFAVIIAGTIIATAFVTNGLI